MPAKVKRSYRDIFMDKLKELSGEVPMLIGNKSLCEALGWDLERYRRIRNQLLDEGLVISGRGKGGSVGLSDSPGSQLLKVFVAYSHGDESMKNELLKHLEPLKRLNLVDAWSDRKLMPGDEWEGKIEEALESADIILLLVSIDFINSKYCYDVELERALERHAEHSAVVIPVILRNCLWQYSPFAKLQALPKDGKAVTSWIDRDEAFVNIADGVRRIAEQIQTSKD